MNQPKFLDLVRSGDFVVVDTETTGVNDDEIIEIAIVDGLDQWIFTALVKPSVSIPKTATLVHGITDEMVKDAPSWSHVYEMVKAHLQGRNIIAYNSAFDRRMLLNTIQKSGTNDTAWLTRTTWRCAMHFYAEHYGDWNEYHNSYRWQTLKFACEHEKIPVSGYHGALQDAENTMNLIRKLAKQDAQ